MNRDQKNYLIQQMRSHAQWVAGNVALTIPMAFTESEVAYALGDAGFVINQRPITDVSLAPTAEMLTNQDRFRSYQDTVNAVLSSYIEDVHSGESDNPAAVLANFVADVSQVAL